MKEVKLEQFEQKLKEKKLFKLDFGEKSYLDLKNLMGRKRKEEEIKLNKTFASQIQMNMDKNDLSEDKIILRKVCNNNANRIKLQKHSNNYNKNLKANTFIIIFISLLIPNNNIIEFNSFYIKIKIQGIGESNTFSSSFNRNYYPNIIYINDIQNYDINYIYYFTEIINNVTLLWNNTINNCKNMFNGCSNITEIDLSNFDSSNVINMEYMFYNCSKLSLLNLSNFKTSNVISMNKMSIM